MADPEIDEAAAVAWFEKRPNLDIARAALRWKARAEAAEKSAREAACQATVERASAKWWRDKCESAEAERDSLRLAADALVRFIEAFDARQMRGISDEFYSIHGGDDYSATGGASLRLSSLRQLAQAVKSR